MEKNTIEIINFEERYAHYFMDINLEWLNNNFYVEDYDRKILSQPTRAKSKKIKIVKRFLEIFFDRFYKVFWLFCTFFGQMYDSVLFGLRY